MLLKQYLDEKGVKMSWLSENAGISETSLWRKTRGLTGFSLAEAVRISEALKLSDEEIRAIFFTSEVN